MRIQAAVLCTATLVTACAHEAALEAHPVAIVGATVVHPAAEATSAMSRDMTILMRGSRIEAVGPAATTAVSSEYEVIDGKGKWVIPGLIDTHVHFFQSGNLYTRPDAVDLTRAMPYVNEVARNKARLATTFKVWLASGVTSVIDVGGPFWNFEVRDVARTTPVAPRVAVAGPLVSMVDAPKLDLGDPPIVKITTPEAARELVTRQLARKPDYVKVWFIHRPGDDLAAQTAIVKSAADTAHAAGVPLAVHATELVTAKEALRVGADFLVHSVYDVPVDDEFLALMKARKALYCPTLFVYLGYGYALSNMWRPTEAEARLADPEILGAMRDLERIPKDQLPAGLVKMMEAGKTPQANPVAAANLLKIAKAGIPVTMGTDAGNIGTLHGPSVFREMAMMKDAGLSNLQVLRSATVNGAKALRMENELGQVAPGMLADLVVLNADPLADLGALSNAYRVLRNGVVFDPAALAASMR
jgi:imidazolonepropionase-like amidohydrolase